MAFVGCAEDDPPPPPPPPQPGDTASNPITRVESIALGDMTSPNSGWKQLLTSIQNTGKYINLDLSACTMNGTVFNPDPNTENGAGKVWIVSLVLPNAATSIPDGTSSLGPFNYFELRSISGANITTIGSHAFHAATLNLQTASFPNATTINEGAFYGCNKLTTLNIPKVTTINYNVFTGTGSTALTITMGTTAPATLSASIFSGVNSSKTVMVKVPNEATGYTPATSPFNGTSNTLSGTNNTANWGNGFRGGGWTGSAFTNASSINQNITVTIQSQ